MAGNTLTNLIPFLYESLDVVSRELTGFIPGISFDASAERAALNQAIEIPVTEAQAAADVTPGQLPPDTGDQNVIPTSVTITKSRMIPFRWTGEEQKGLKTGPGYNNIRRDQITQAMRGLVNEFEADIAIAAAVGASRAYGTPGTTPFAADLSDMSALGKILKDNGAPQSDLQFVMDTTAGMKVRNLTQLTKANEAGTTDMREQGTLLDIFGFKLRESAGVKKETSVGSATLATASAATGATAVTITTGATTGAVSLSPGDIVTFAGDTNMYVVQAALTLGASATGTLYLNKPGLLTTLASAAMSVVAASTRNVGFARSAIVGVCRAPALPEEGDMAEDRMTIVDPRTGLAFEISMYAQYRRVHYEVALAWGAANIKAEHSALILG